MRSTSSRSAATASLASFISSTIGERLDEQRLARARACRGRCPARRSGELALTASTGRPLRSVMKSSCRCARSPGEAGQGPQPLRRPPPRVGDRPPQAAQRAATRRRARRSRRARRPRSSAIGQRAQRRARSPRPIAASSGAVVRALRQHAARVERDPHGRRRRPRAWPGVRTPPRAACAAAGRTSSAPPRRGGPASWRRHRLGRARLPVGDHRGVGGRLERRGQRRARPRRTSRRRGARGSPAAPGRRARAGPRVRV